MQPEIHVFGLTLQTFGLCFAFGFIASAAVIGKRLQEWGKPADWAYEIAFAALIGGLVGSRVDFLIENYSDVKGDLLGNIVSGSGLVWYGGAIGGAIAVLAWARWRGMLNLALTDMCAVPLALGYAIGRIGCQLSGDGDYGQPWDGPWAMSYPNGTVPTDTPVHPTPIYETLIMGLVAFVLWRLRDRFATGVLFALYLLCAGFERFMIEFIRRNDDAALGLTPAQLLSLGVMLVGAAILTWRWRGEGLYAATVATPSAASRHRAGSPPR